MSRRYRRRNQPSRCHDWPYCACGDRYDHWAETLTAFPPPQFTPSEQEEIKFGLVFMLSCMALHCPDPKFRRHALLQLMHPIFADEAKHWIN